MIAVDTNVIVRLVTADDPAQTVTAREVFNAGDLWICKTVLLETEWVLRYSYKLSRDSVGKALRGLLGNRQLQVEDRGAVLEALRLYDQGLDFADALHLVSSGEADRFVTFDRPLWNRTRDLEGGPAVHLLKGSSP
ncbi:MAG TPA: type II toxin-antitoxin system VapC family toxin [Thermoanaerobaculia bacterium]